MLRRILSYGVAAGLIVGVPLFCLAIAMNGQPPPSYGAVLGYLIMLVALGTIILAIKRHRDRDLGGIIAFWPAFGLGLGISIIASIFYVLAWEAVLAVTQADFAGGYAETLIAQQKAKGVSGEALAKFSADMEKFRADYANPFYRTAMTFTEIFPVGVLVSLISAGVLRKSRVTGAKLRR